MKKTLRAKGETLIKRTCREVPDFLPLYKKLERSFSVAGYSQSTLTNYSRCLAQMAQHYNMNPVHLDEDRIAEATGAGLWVHLHKGTEFSIEIA